MQPAAATRAPGTAATAPDIPVANIKAESKLADGKEVVFPEVLKYECQNGYTLDGFPKGNKDFEFSCKAACLFSDAPVFNPVLNGTLSKAEHATLIGSAPVCAGGFSIVANDDILQPTSNNFLVSCQASGEVALLACANIDDGLMRSFGVHGSCNDLPVPARTPLDDYTCKCDGGYEITLPDTQPKPFEQRKVCTNINDCPSPVQEACGGHNAEGKGRGS